MYSRCVISIKPSNLTDLMKKYWALLFTIVILSCSSEEDYDPEASFTKIYDSYQGNLNYYPIDIAETGNGFIVLTGKSTPDSDFSGVQLLYLDKEGDFVSERDFSSEYYIPVGKMTSIDSVAYFFAMEPVTFQAVMIKTSDSLVTEVTPLNGLYYPLASNTTSDNQLLLLGFNPQAEQTYITKIDLNGNNTGGIGYSIGAGSDMEENIINHYVNPEQHGLPFFCGEWSPGQYYFNGIYNYSLSLVFSDLSNFPTGVVQGQGFNGGITQILPLQGSNFAVFGYQFNDNFLVPSASINTTGLSSSIDLLETSISEFRSRTPSDIITWESSSASYHVVAAETESRQVALYFYESATAELKAIHKIGYINPYTLASIKTTADGGLLVLGSTYVGGRFQRVFLTKLEQSEVEDLVE